MEENADRVSCCVVVVRSPFW